MCPKIPLGAGAGLQGEHGVRSARRLWSEGERGCGYWGGVTPIPVDRVWAREGSRGAGEVERPRVHKSGLGCCFGHSHFKVIPY